MNWPLFFKNRRNKILAIGFSALGTACYLVCVIRFLIASASGFGSSDYIISLISHIFEFGLMAYLLLCNINNDNRAYNAILMWIFWFFLDQFREVIYGQLGLFSALRTGNIYFIAFATIAFGAGIASFAVGLTLYLTLRRYMVGREDSFKRIRRLAIAYASLAGATLLFQSIVFFFVSGLPPMLVMEILLATIAELFIHIAVIFTLERLRRVY